MQYQFRQKNSRPIRDGSMANRCPTGGADWVDIDAVVTLGDAIATIGKL